MRSKNSKNSTARALGGWCFLFFGVWGRGVGFWGWGVGFWGWGVFFGCFGVCGRVLVLLGGVSERGESCYVVGGC